MVCFYVQHSHRAQLWSKYVNFALHQKMVCSAVLHISERRRGTQTLRGLGNLLSPLPPLDGPDMHTIRTLYLANVVKHGTHS